MVLTPNIDAVGKLQTNGVRVVECRALLSPLRPNGFRAVPVVVGPGNGTKSFNAGRSLQRRP